MGARSITAQLTRGVLAVVAPALVVVGVASVAVTARVLDRSDAESARTQAKIALRMLHDELAEGDTLPAAAKEVLDAADADGVRMVIRVGAFSASTRAASPSELSSLRSGVCARVTVDGAPFAACAEQDGERVIAVALPVSAHVAAVRSLASAMTVIVLAVLGAVLFALRRAVRAPTTALRELASWSDRVDSEGPLDAPPRGDSEETTRVSTALDALVARLREALERERAVGAHLAHELRTPLTTIRAELEALGDHASASRLRSDVDRLSRVIDAVLVLSRPGAARRATTVVNVADVVRARARGTEVSAPEEALVEGDEELVALALDNLLDNAERHAGRALRIALRREQGAVELAVEDDGPGIDEASRGRMFDRYWRGAADGPGSGLGLALVRAVAERHGGRAAAQPRAGGGLSVSMTLSPLVGWYDGAPLGNG